MLSFSIFYSCFIHNLTYYLFTIMSTFINSYLSSCLAEMYLTFEGGGAKVLN